MMTSRHSPSPATRPVARMNKMLRSLAATLALGSVAFVAHAQSSDDQALIQRGAYVAHLADCAACHTGIGGKLYAGGLQIKTPIGAIYSTNITPDAGTGIGGYTFEQFDQAVRQGIRKDGSTLYPAMPYPSFARMTEDDMKALYAYFMHGVQPVAQTNKAVDISWPMSMRWPLAIWRKVFAPTPTTATTAPSDDNPIARGEYLVTGAGHCGACHTPRGTGMQEKALDGSSPDFLSGGAPIDNWIAPSLRSNPNSGLGRWSEEDIYYFLKTGRTDHAAVFGGMADVVAWSTQHYSDDDLHAIAKYLKSLPEVPAQGAAYAYNDATAKALDQGDTSGHPGADTYVKQCAICHRNDGGGVARMFPPLAGNPVIMSGNPTSLVNVIVNGGVLPPTNWAPSAVAMPAYKHDLTDQQIADVANYIRQAWGNQAEAPKTVVTASAVQALREHDMPVSDISGWLRLTPQPYGAGWTFAPQTHTGKDEAQ